MNQAYVFKENSDGRNHIRIASTFDSQSSQAASRVRVLDLLRQTNKSGSIARLYKQHLVDARSGLTTQYLKSAKLS